MLRILTVTIALNTLIAAVYSAADISVSTNYKLGHTSDVP